MENMQILLLEKGIYLVNHCDYHKSCAQILLHYLPSLLGQGSFHTGLVIMRSQQSEAIELSDGVSRNLHTL